MEGFGYCWATQESIFCNSPLKPRTDLPAKFYRNSKLVKPFHLQFTQKKTADKPLYIMDRNVENIMASSSTTIHFTRLVLSCLVGGVN